MLKTNEGKEEGGYFQIDLKLSLVWENVNKMVRAVKILPLVLLPS